MTSPKDPLGQPLDALEPEYEKTLAMDLSAATGAKAAPLQTLAASLPDVQRAADEPPTQADERALTLDDSLGDDEFDEIDAPTEAVLQRPVALFDPNRANALTDDNAPPSKVPTARLNPAASIQPAKAAAPQPAAAPAPTPAPAPKPTDAPKPAAAPTPAAPKPADAPAVHHHPTWKRLPSVISVSLIFSLVAIITVIILFFIY